MRVEDPEKTYLRHQRILDLVLAGITKVATDRYAQSDAEHWASRHAGTFAAEIRAHLIDWLEPQLADGWELERLPFSGVEVHGPGIVISVRRPDAEGHVPEADSDRKAGLYQQDPMFVLDAKIESGMRIDHLLVPSYLIMTWGFDPELSTAWMKLSAPSGPTSWHWADAPIEPDELHSDVPPAAEEDDDPLADDNSDERRGRGAEE